MLQAFRTSNEVPKHLVNPLMFVKRNYGEYVYARLETYVSQTIVVSYVDDLQIVGKRDLWLQLATKQN